MIAMDRRKFLTELSWLAGSSLLSLAAVGCRGKTITLTLLSTNDRDVVGSHAAGAETWEPLIQESVAKLLGRQHAEIVQQNRGHRRHGGMQADLLRWGRKP